MRYGFVDDARREYVITTPATPLLWIICAGAVLGRGNEAFDLYRRICPAYLEKKSEIHETKPAAIPATSRTAGSPVRPPGPSFPSAGPFWASSRTMTA